MDHILLNVGLKLALEFGTNWQQPIQSRLSEKFPELRDEELDNFNTVCRAAMNQGHGYIYKKLEETTNGSGEILQSDLAKGLELVLHKDYPWIDSENMERILSQGIYYAWKDGLDNCILG